ncbi:phosphotransferase [Bdellovibrio bacteriovorus]|uniref:aminoglycoside phosphotransferase family protein n=1 Tax=Bdellovibrio bacteriovorus TaxID=959 RepID=UPI0021CE75E8|nr:phosphotransferase [Bdellovibrio bacteriovorus]UXR63744.1 phosphotransferase [Bdellovibrio bacteriovorus]
MGDLSEFRDLSIIRKCKDIIPISEGWSGDLKFQLVLDQESYLLRLTAKDLATKKEEQFKASLPLRGLGLPLSTPLEFGMCQYRGEDYCYTLLSWVPGQSAADILREMSADGQYKMGCQSGKILKAIHSIPIASKYQELNWELYFNRKLNRNIQLSRECPVKWAGQDKIISYIENNRRLLAGRPIGFHHGDYHVGNMLIHNQQELGIIDFNRLDHGDPWEEFNRITWCARLSPHFATGRVNGYFSNDVPEDFFRLLALYIASNQLSSVPWAIQFGAEQVQVMLAEVESVLSSYDNFGKYIPDWYLQDCDL